MGLYWMEDSNAWSGFLRYQSLAERNYRRTLEDFHSLRRQALKKTQNEPIFGA